nr:hypothetical protein [Tanacetum cinerariifolium]
MTLRKFPEFAATSIIPALSIEFTATPHVLSTAPVHVTSTPITSTTHSPCFTGGCNCDTARKRFRHPPARRLAPLVPSSNPSRSSSRLSVGPSPKRRKSSVTSVTTAAHTPAAVAPAQDGMETDVEADSEADTKPDSGADVRIDVGDETYTEDYDTDIRADIAADAEADCNPSKNGSQRNMFPGALLHNTIAQVIRERPLTVSFEKKS